MPILRTILLGGTNVTFPVPPQTLNRGITIDVLTLSSEGTYYIACELDTTLGLLLSNRSLIKGVACGFPFFLYQ
ncbi:hypothetical protein NSS66_21050 [Paenibacillus sp. FSL R10-2748]|uniref:hypothetical protein n=1 Tax=Paenibacillus peoriae TaxID=59893 RepID=UPI0011815915|nr:hypothetical protein [Paenibacillus peoriae]